MNIKKLREWRGLSQEHVAKELSLSRTTYTKYENGVHDPSLETLVNISNFFDVPVDYIAGGTFCSLDGFSDRLRQCREAQEDDVRNAATLLDVSEDLYEAFEDGRAEPTLAMVCKLAQAYHTTAEYLLGLSAPDSEEFGALMTADERRLVTLFRQSDPRDRAIIWAVLSKYLRSEQSQETEPRKDEPRETPAPRNNARERAAARREVPPREPPARQKQEPRQVALPTRETEPRRGPDARPRPTTTLPTRQPPAQGHSAPPLPQHPQPSPAGQGALYERIRTAFKGEKHGQG